MERITNFTEIPQKKEVNFTKEDYVNSVHNRSVKEYVGKNIKLFGFAISINLSTLKTDIGYLGATSNSIRKSLEAIYLNYSPEEIKNGLDFTIISGEKGRLYLEKR